jgi:hypothetical protein
MKQDIQMGPQSNRADLSESYQWIEDGTAVTLTGATIKFSARDPVTRTEVLSASTDDGKITISTTTMTLSIGKSELNALCAKNYDIGCTITIDDATDQLFVGSLEIYDGVVSS